MEGFRNKIRKRVRVYTLLSVISLTGVVLLTVFGRNNYGFNATSGFFGGLLGVSLVNVIQSKKALKDEKRLKELYIRKNDERYIRIERETSATMFNVVLIGLSTATIVSNFFSTTISSTLSVCLAFILVVYAAVSVYYNKKI